MKLIQCNDSNTRLHKRRKESYNVKRHQLTNECLKALLHCGSDYYLARIYITAAFLVS